MSAYSGYKHRVLDAKPLKALTERGLGLSWDSNPKPTPQEVDTQLTHPSRLFCQANKTTKTPMPMMTAARKQQLHILRPLVVVCGLLSRGRPRYQP